MYKRGISETVTLVLLVLVPLTFIVLVWILIRPVLMGTGEQVSSNSRFGEQLSIVPGSVSIDNANHLASFIVNVNVNDSTMEGFLVRLEDISQSAITIPYNDLDLH